jgi:hypothetical protein
VHQVQAENPEDIKHAIPARTFFARLAELQSPSCLWMGTCQKENDRLQRCLESLSGKSTLTADSVFKSIRHQARSHPVSPVAPVWCCTAWTAPLQWLLQYRFFT